MQSVGGLSEPLTGTGQQLVEQLRVPSLSERLAVRDVSIASTRRLIPPVVLGSTAVLFIIPLLVSPQAMVRPAPLTWGDLVALLLVALLAGSITGAWVWAEVAVARRRGRTRLLGFLAAYALAGAVVAGVMELLLPLAGFTARAPMAIPIISMAIMAPWLAILLGAARDGRQRIRDARSAMVEQAAAVVLSSERQAAFIEDLRRQLRGEVETSLRPSFELTAQRLAFESQFTQDRVTSSAAQVLKELTEASVRPFSQSLDQRTRDRGDRRGPVAFVRGVARHQSFRPLPVALVFTVTSLADVATGRDVMPVVTSAAAGVLLIFIILGTGNLLMRRWPRWHSSIFVGTFLALQIPTIVWGLATQSPVGIDFVGEMALTVLVSGGVIWLTSGVSEWRAPQAELLRIYAEDLDAARIEMLAQAEILRSITREAARALHGSVQSKLTACIVALDRSSQTGDVKAHAEAVARARMILSDSWAVPPQSEESGSIHDAVRVKVSLWQGLASITAYVDASLSTVRGPLARRVSDVVEEGMCNAIRHGMADAVSVHVERVEEGEASCIRVRIVDDGTGPGESTPGMGSAYLDEVCQGRWTRAALPEGGCSLDAWVIEPAV